MSPTTDRSDRTTSPHDDLREILTCVTVSSACQTSLYPGLRMPSSRSVYSSGHIDDLDRRASKLRWHLIKIDDGLGNCSELSDNRPKLSRSSRAQSHGRSRAMIMRVTICRPDIPGASMVENRLPKVLKPPNEPQSMQPRGISSLPAAVFRKRSSVLMKILHVIRAPRFCCPSRTISSFRSKAVT